jgi:hypothetical protein
MPPSTLKRLSGLAGILAGVVFIVAELLNLLVIPDTLSAAFDDLGEIAITNGFFSNLCLRYWPGCCCWWLSSASMSPNPRPPVS